MPWNQDNPYSGYTPMNLSNAGLSWGGRPTTAQYDGGNMMNSLYPNYMQPSLWDAFPMNSGLPMNKFGGGGYNPLQSLLSGIMNIPQDGYSWSDPSTGMGGAVIPSYAPTQWAGPNAHYPNWDDPAGPYANDVAIMNMGTPPMGATYWDEAGNQHQAGGQPGFWSPNLLPPPLHVDPPRTATPVPTDPSLPPPWWPPRPPQQGDPDWEGPDPEMVQERLDRTRRTSQNFYRNNPDHFLSKLDSRLRDVFGVRQLDSPGQLAGKPTVDYTQQTQAQPQIDYGTAPFGTMDIPNAQGDLGLMDANRQVREANARRAAQAQENARIAADQARRATPIQGLRSWATGGPSSQSLGALGQRGRNYGRWAENQRIEREKQRNQQKAAAARRAAAKRAAAARTAKQKAGVARRSAEGEGRDTAGERSAGMGGGRGGFAGPDRW